MSPSAIVQKLWNYCNVLRDDGLSYGDYVEQLTYLLFLKMADERTKAAVQPAGRFPTGTVGRACSRGTATTCEIHYRHTLEELGKRKGMLGVIFTQGPEQDPGPGQAAAADRRPDRQRALVHR